MGIDPGLVGTGYGVLGAGGAWVAVLETGVIETAAQLPLDERVLLIYDGVRRVLDKHAPALVVLEDLYSSYKFPRTALLMAHARGVICLAARQQGVAVLTLTAAEVKRAVAASGSASKEQIQHCVRRRLALDDLPRPFHVADALALAITGLSRVGGRLP